jgi:hypothetical protein
MLYFAGRHVRIRLWTDGLHAVSGTGNEGLPTLGSGTPTAVLALMLRLFRGLSFARPAARPSRQRSVARTGVTVRPNRTLPAIYHDFLAWAAAQGYARLPGETPDELAARVSSRLPECSSSAATLTGLFVAHRYGRRPVLPADLVRAEQALTTLQRQPEPVASRPVEAPNLLSRA